MNRIKILREEFKISQEELAKKLDLSKGIISMYENESRKPSYEVLLKLSEIFNCSIDYIVGISNERTNEINIAQSGGLDTEGLSDEELEEVKKQIEYMKWKKNNNK